MAIWSLGLGLDRVGLDLALGLEEKGPTHAAAQLPFSLRDSLAKVTAIACAWMLVIQHLMNTT